MAIQNKKKALAKGAGTTKGFWQVLWRILPEILLLLIFLFCYTLRLNIDFWNDEIYTLLHFTFTPIQQTVGSYPVPNNHVLFNLINNIYLKCIRVDSFASLIEHPLKLRILFFLYALLTAVFTYKIGRKFFNRSTARLATIILLTTVPYFNFALQARGYGLSALLLVWVVYGSLSYEKSKKSGWLMLVCLATAAAVYTLPSNLLPIGAVLLPYGFYFLGSLMRFRKNGIPTVVKALRQNIPFRILLSLVAGIGLALLCYTPIFKDVFFNEYTTDAEPFKFEMLKFYSTHLSEGIVSGRWILLAVSFIGFLGIGASKKWLWPLLLFFCISILPVIVVYIEGLKPPLRTFVYFAPFTALILGLGLHGFARRFLPRGKTPLLYFLGVTLYALGTLYFEVQKVETVLVKDIKNEGRSQTLYAQYYSDHYTPLKAVKRLKSLRATTHLPVLISGCEPHGVPNYLKALGVPFHRFDLRDSLLRTHDSIYIVTNHPQPFLQLSEYTGRVLNDIPNYHNLLLFSKSATGYAVRKEMERLGTSYADSVGFVLNVFSKGTYADFAASHACYFLSDSAQTQVGRLIDFASHKPYLCYLDMMGTAPGTMAAIASDRRREIDLPTARAIPTAYLGKQTDAMSPADNQAHATAERLDSTREYSSNYSTETGKLEAMQTLKISLDASFQAQTEALLVISIVHKNEPVVWKGIRLEDYYTEGAEWQRIVAAYTLPNDLLYRDELSIYIWNPKKEVVLVDDLQVVPFRQKKETE